MSGLSSPHSLRPFGVAGTPRAHRREGEWQYVSATPRPATAPRVPRVEKLSWEELSARASAWAHLAARRLEANVFMEPCFALSAAQHFVAARRPSFLVVSDDGPLGRDRLIGICPLETGSRRQVLTRGWRPRLFALGNPLLDRNRAAEALDLMLDWVAREQPLVAGLVFPAVVSDGPTAALLRLRARALNLELRQTDQGQRAALRSAAGQPAEPASISAKHHKELRRQARRLGELGAVAFVSARQPEEVRDQVEQFLALEARGWKGARGTALLSDPGNAAFTRAMTRRLARDSQCRVDALTLDAAPIAMGITLISGDTAYLWKIAFDESFAAFSPGVQFILDYTRQQRDDGAIALTDSCAIPNHPMIDRLWTDRIPIADFAIAVPHRRAEIFSQALRGEDFRRHLRVRAKSLYYAALGRKQS